MATETLDYLAPAYRQDPNAAEFAEALGAALDWSPSDFGSGYAWESPVPPRETWAREIAALAAHVQALAAGGEE